MIGFFQYLCVMFLDFHKLSQLSSNPEPANFLHVYNIQINC